MFERLILLRSRDPEHIRILRVPEDLNDSEAYRTLTGIVGRLEQERPEFAAEELNDLLENYGFESLDFLVGPEMS